MRCPRCGATPNDSEALFCARCGAALGGTEGESTERLDAGSGATSELPPPITAGGEGPSRRDQTLQETVVPFVRDLATAARRVLVSGGWPGATAAAALGFLGVLAVGAILLLAGKLQYPALGAGASPLDVLTAIVLLGFTTLRIPIQLGSLELSVLPLGALVVVGAGIASAARIAVGRRDAPSVAGKVLEGAKVGAPFAVMACLAAALFSFGGSDPVRADPVLALFIAGVWGAIFGAAGGLLAAGPLRDHARAALKLLEARSRSAYEAALAGMLMVGIVFVLAAGAALVWAIVGLARGGPADDFTFADAGAALVYVAAFGPNILVAFASFSFGAAIEIGTQVTQEGRLIGTVRDFSMFDWPAGDTPSYVFLLLLVPSLAGLAGGFFARRSTRNHHEVVPVLGGAALVFALTFSLLGALGEARLGAGLVRERGLGRIAPDSGMVLLLGYGWAAAAGYLGWRIAGSSGMSLESSKEGSEDADARAASGAPAP